MKVRASGKKRRRFSKLVRRRGRVYVIIAGHLPRDRKVIENGDDGRRRQYGPLVMQRYSLNRFGGTKMASLHVARLAASLNRIRYFNRRDILAAATELGLTRKWSKLGYPAKLNYIRQLKYNDVAVV